MRRLQNNSLALVLFLLFALSWVGQGVSQWQEFRLEQQEHKQPATVAEFMPEFWSATFENWQSEYLQLFSFVVLTSLFVFKGSPESKDGDERMEQSLARIERRLLDMEGSR